MQNLFLSKRNLWIKTYWFSTARGDTFLLFIFIETFTILFLIYANYPSTLYNVKSDLFDLDNSFGGINERESRA